MKTKKTRRLRAFFLKSPAIRAQGFTLIEMLTTMSVAAVLLAAAAPGLAGFVRSSRINGAQSELVSALMLARSEAAKRGVDVQMVGADALQPTNFAAGWQVGWDKNGDGVIDASAGSEELIRAYPALGKNVVVTASQAAPAVRFAATGFLSPPTRVVFNVCDSGDTSSTGEARGYRVSLEAVGLADIKPFADITPRPTCP